MNIYLYEELDLLVNSNLEELTLLSLKIKDLGVGKWAQSY